MKKIEYLLKHNVIIQKMYQVVFSLIFKFIGLFVKRDMHRVLFQSMIGKKYSDSPQVIYEKMLSDKAFKDYKYVWAFDDPSKFDLFKAKKVKLNSLSYFIEALRCGVWITNVSIERGLKFKPRKTIYLNTWHGVTLKFLGNAQKTRNDYDYGNVNYMLSSCEYLDEIFIRDFKIKPSSLVRCGLPRNDYLYDSNRKKVEYLKKKYNIPKDKKVILYAPTWRDSTDGGKNYVIKPPLDVEYLREKLSNKYVILFRMHHLTTKQLGIKFDDFIRDCSGEYDINELMMISDVLISDYSATIFDYSILERPIVLFAYDYEEYKQTRGLYLELEDILPGAVCKTQKELVKHILRMNYRKECKKAKVLKERFNTKNGDATEICLECLKNRIVGDKHE